MGRRGFPSGGRGGWRRRQSASWSTVSALQRFFQEPHGNRDEESIGT